MTVIAVERVKLGAKRQLTIPLQAASALGLKPGDVLELRVIEGRMELVPMALIPRDQIWYWTPEWQAMEAEADKALAESRYRDHDSAEGVIADLES